MVGKHNCFCGWKVERKVAVTLPRGASSQGEAPTVERCRGVQKQKRGGSKVVDRATTLRGMQHEALVGLSLGNPQNHPVRTGSAFGYQLLGSTKPQSQPH